MGNKYKTKLLVVVTLIFNVQIVIILGCVWLPIFVKMKPAFIVLGSRYNSIANEGYSSTIWNFCEFYSTNI
jgi:hypothetical protein